jgi:ATP-dependent Clp protease ATP-binding subunit ClpB
MPWIIWPKTVTTLNNQLSKKILAGSIDKTKPVLVDVFDGTVVFRNETNETEKVAIKKK